MSERAFVIQADLICDECDKFRVGWFSLAAVHCVAENLIDHLKLPAAPRHLNGMADSRSTGLR